MRRLLPFALAAALLVPALAHAAPAVKHASVRTAMPRHRHFDRMQAWTQHLTQQGTARLKNIGQDLFKQLKAGKKLNLANLRNQVAGFLKMGRKPATKELDHAAAMAMHFATDAIHKEAAKGGIGGKLASFAEKQLAAHHKELDKGIDTLMTKLGDEAQGGVLKALSWI